MFAKDKTSLCSYNLKDQTFKDEVYYESEEAISRINISSDDKFAFLKIYGGIVKVDLVNKTSVSILDQSKTEYIYNSMVAYIPVE